MRKLIVACLFVLMVLPAGQALANLGDNRASMASQYGEYRLVIDKDGKLWTKADWEAGGYAKTKANAYVYYFTRNGLKFQMEVQYDGTSPESMVKVQRITPDSEIKIAEFKGYFPEIYPLIADPKAQAFITGRQLTRNFQSVGSPISLGVVTSGPAAAKGAYDTLFAFNIQGEGKLIEDPNDINKDVYIQEFTIEQTIPGKGEEGAIARRFWKFIKNPF